jgi:hypothetical protein
MGKIKVTTKSTMNLIANEIDVNAEFIMLHIAKEQYCLSTMLNCSIAFECNLTIDNNEYRLELPVDCIYSLEHISETK